MHYTCLLFNCRLCTGNCVTRQESLFALSWRTNKKFITLFKMDLLLEFMTVTAFEEKSELAIFLGETQMKMSSVFVSLVTISS
jgi:hypothetical protein